METQMNMPKSVALRTNSGYNNEVTRIFADLRFSMNISQRTFAASVKSTATRCDNSYINRSFLLWVAETDTETAFFIGVTVEAFDVPVLLGLSLP